MRTLAASVLAFGLIVTSSCQQPSTAQEILDRSRAKAAESSSDSKKSLDSGAEEEADDTSSGEADSPDSSKPTVPDASSDEPVVSTPDTIAADPLVPVLPTKPVDPVDPPESETPIPPVVVKATDPLAPIPAGKTIRIMPLGASITQGVGSKKAGARSVLHRLMNEAKIPHLFVGSNKAQPGDMPANQQNHEGHPGWTIQNIAGQTQGIQEKLGGWVPAAKPDYVLILVGSNDITRYWQLDKIGERIEKVIDTINNKSNGLAKDATIIIASLPVIKDAKQEVESKKYRDKIMEVVVKQKKAGMKVGFIDVNGALKAEHMTDNLHPNDQGFEIIGKMFFDRMMGK